jgi:hypothetical protein
MAPFSWERAAELSDAVPQERHAPVVRIQRVEDVPVEDERAVNMVEGLQRLGQRGHRWCCLLTHEA